MFADLLNSSYFALFLIVALGFMLGRIKLKDYLWTFPQSFSLLFSLDTSV